MTRSRQQAFTLIELMITVVVFSILTVVATVSYSKYIRKAKVNEVINFMTDIKIKQETYFSQYGQYVDTSSNGVSFGDGDFYPGSIAGGEKSWAIKCPDDQAAYPGWCALGAHPGSLTVDYQFVTVGWAPGDGDPPSQYIRDPQRRWWYAVARGDIDEDGAYSSFVYSSELTEVNMWDETE